MDGQGRPQERPSRVSSAADGPPEWVNLNGLWDYAIRPRDSDQPATFDGQILVPFPVESALSRRDEAGQTRPAALVPSLVRPEPSDRAGAGCSTSAPSTGTPRSSSTAGGWASIAAATIRSPSTSPTPWRPGATQELIVSVWDPTDQGSQPRGKQVLKPGGIMYTANTGHLADRLARAGTRDADRRTEDRSRPRRGRGSRHGQAGRRPGPARSSRWRPRWTATARSAPPRDRPPRRSSIKIPNAKLWSPDQPFLYGLRVGIAGGDEVTSYFGMRKIAVAKDDSGINRLMLNGKPLFQLGPLDQGCWPDGLYTAPTDEALKYDLEVTKKLGFNMIRKHVKVEPDRWYYWCDTLGMLVWQDMPAGDNKDDAAKQQFAVELERMIDALRNHPSIVMWVPFNEGWGQHDTPQLRRLDQEARPDPAGQQRQRLDRHAHRRRLRHAQLSRPRHAAARDRTAPRCSASSAAWGCRSRAISGSTRTTGAIGRSRTRRRCDRPTSS